jgi:nickel-dependent lactate racemase
MSRPATRRLPYGRGTLDLPPRPFLLHPISPPPVRGDVAGPGGQGLTHALRHPTSGPDPAEIFRGARRILIVVSDATRSTGAAQFLPPLVDGIRASCRAEITFIVASGIHRRPAAHEIEAILGPEIAARFPTLIHDADRFSGLAEIGRTRAGTPVRVNSALLDHDRIVLTGAAGFHYYAGFSGGRKSLVPGLAARETVSCNHLRALTRDGARHKRARAGCLHGNPVHRDMAEGAAMLGPHLLVNSVMGSGGSIERLFVGSWRQAHEAACRYVRSSRTVRVEPRNLVVVSAGGEPSDINIIQAHKAFDSGVRALKPGGVLILVAACREGAGHDDFLPWFRFADEDEWVRTLRAKFEVYGQTALSWFRKATRYRVIVVSELEPRVVEKLGATPARDLEDAFRLAREHLPGATEGWLMPHGSRVLPQAVAAR